LEIKATSTTVVVNFRHQHSPLELAPFEQPRLGQVAEPIVGQQVARPIVGPLVAEPSIVHFGHPTSGHVGQTILGPVVDKSISGQLSQPTIGQVDQPALGPAVPKTTLSHGVDHPIIGHDVDHSLACHDDQPGTFSAKPKSGQDDQPAVGHIA
jgi:hypothetical protein